MFKRKNYVVNYELITKDLSVKVGKVHTANTSRLQALKDIERILRNDYDIVKLTVN
jgi:flavoprotein